VLSLPYKWDEYADCSGGTPRYGGGVRIQVKGHVMRDRDQNPIPIDTNDPEDVKLWDVGPTNGQPYSRVPDSGRGFEWRLTLYPKYHTDTFFVLKRMSVLQRRTVENEYLMYIHGMTPEVVGVRYWNWPTDKRITLTNPKAIDTGISVSANQTDGDMSLRGNIVLDNMVAQHKEDFFKTTQPPHVVMLGDWCDETGSGVDGTSGYLYAGQLGIPQMDVTPNSSIRLTSEFQDNTLRLLEAKSDGQVPPFDGWLVRDAVFWILDHLGVYADETTIEDTGLHLSVAPMTSHPYWYAEKGRSWSDMLKEICTYDYLAAIRIGPDGVVYKSCPYCSTLRSKDPDSPDYAPLHVNGGWYGTACYEQDKINAGNEWGVHRWLALNAEAMFEVMGGVAESMSYEVTSWSLEDIAIEEEFFNHVVVTGAKRMGEEDPISSEFTWWASVHGDPSVPYALGYKKTLTKTYEWANTRPTLNRIGYALFKRSICAPIYINVTIPFAPNILMGDVMAIYGNAPSFIYGNGKRWRVVGITHNISQATGPAATTLRCRYIGGVGS